MRSLLAHMSLAIHGWSPDDGDDVDVENICFIPPFHPSKRPFPSSSSSMAPSSDRRTQRNRSRDPTWIPRPRNAFIIFRCEYSREHTQSNGDDDDDDDDDHANSPSPPSNASNPQPNLTAKTLSKRAAEAWKQLSPSEKERYKLLADKEREEHARLYPHYRFRPMRRQTQTQTQTHVPPSVNRHSFDGAVQPVVLASSSPTRLPSVLADTLPSSPIPQTHHSTTPPRLVPSQHSTINTTRDTNLQLPSSNTNQPSIPPPWHVSATPVIDVDVDVRGTQTEFEYTRPGPSPLASVTSSLMGWNNDPAPQIQTTHPQTQAHGTYPYTSIGTGTTAPSLSTTSNPNPTFPSLSTSTSYDNLERAQALEAYAIGLYGHDPTLFMDSEADEMMMRYRMTDSSTGMSVSEDDVWWSVGWSPWSASVDIHAAVFGVEADS